MATTQNDEQVRQGEENGSVSSASNSPRTSQEPPLDTRRGTEILGQLCRYDARYKMAQDSKLNLPQQLWNKRNTFMA